MAMVVALPAPPSPRQKRPNPRILGWAWSPGRPFSAQSRAERPRTLRQEGWILRMRQKGGQSVRRSTQNAVISSTQNAVISSTVQSSQWEVSGKNEDCTGDGQLMLVT